MLDLEHLGLSEVIPIGVISIQTPQIKIFNVIFYVIWTSDCCSYKPSLVEVVAI